MPSKCGTEPDRGQRHSAGDDADHAARGTAAMSQRSAGKFMTLGKPPIEPEARLAMPNARNVPLGSRWRPSDRLHAWRRRPGRRQPGKPPASPASGRRSPIAAQSTLIGLRQTSPSTVVVVDRNPAAASPERSAAPGASQKASVRSGDQQRQVECGRASGAGPANTSVPNGRGGEQFDPGARPRGGAAGEQIRHGQLQAADDEEDAQARRSGRPRPETAGSG